jgi:carboxymethylenebutenolidase
MHSDELSAVVMFHAAPQVGVEQLRTLRAPLLAHFAAEDEFVDVALAEQLQSGLQAAGKPGRVFVYQGAHHAFLNEAEDQYHPDAARLAWARTRAFLQRMLKGGE